MKTNNLIIIGLLINLLLTGCNDDTEIQKLPENKDGNLILYVSNQSFAISPVDIKIYIDEMIAVNEEFDVGSQHNWKAFQFELSTGKHNVKIVSEKGDATLMENFEIIDDKYWAVVDYWYYPDDSGGAGPTPKKFSFDIKNESFYFY